MTIGINKCTFSEIEDILRITSKNTIYHFAKKRDWIESQEYELYGDFLIEKDEFIHCATIEQLENVANNLKNIDNEFIILCIDIDKLKSELKWEADKKNKNKYPHIYGPINADSVINIIQLINEL